MSDQTSAIGVDIATDKGLTKKLLDDAVDATGLVLHHVEQVAEVEPFKTAITMKFMREWPFGVYAGFAMAAGLAQLREMGYEAVFLSVGTQKGRDLAIEGGDLDGVIKAVDYLLNINHGYRVGLGKRVLVIGGALAVACFVKVFGIVFLGAPRSEEHAAGHEAGWQMLLPMTLLALLCALIGLAPALFEGLLQRASLAALPAILSGGVSPLAGLAPLPLLTIMPLSLLALLALLSLWYRARLTAAPVGETVTWGCGYQRPQPRMQYSASSFAQMLTGLFAFALRPDSHRPGIVGIFPRRTRFHSHVPEAVLELVYIPALKRLSERFAGVRKLQNGILQQYVLYTLITLIVLLLSDYL